MDGIDRNSNARSVVYLIGSALSFSDWTIRLTSEEFKDVEFRRLEGIERLRLRDAAIRADVLAIVVDEMALEDLVGSMSVCEAQFPNARLALAYSDLRVARGFLRRQIEAPALAHIGLIPMNVRIDHWFSILRLMLCGEHYLSRDLLAEMAAAPREAETTAAEETHGTDLTAREREVLELVSEGKQNKIIAAELDLSEHTVKLHIHHVIGKLGVRNRTEAAAWFHSKGFRRDLSA
ncbi:MAG: response regulator transcription factor [Pseudomonadota bacterium]